MDATDKILIISEKNLDQIIASALERLKAKAPPEAPSQPQKEWLTNREAMQMLGCSKATLQRYRSQGKLPFSKPGGSIYYRYADLAAFLEKHQKGSR